MKDHVGAPVIVAGALPIAAVERETGLSKDTLRVWERRYGFPQPVRDAADERLYPPEQVERLRLIARLLSRGERAGRVVARPLGELQQRLRQLAATGPGAAVGPEQARLLALLRGHEVAELRRHLNQALVRLGMERFLIELLAPLNVQVGDAWLRGELAVFEEHLYSESVTAVLRSALGNAPMLPQAHRPRVLLTTLPPELHLLGLLMAEALLTLEGCVCVSLGAQTPVSEIVRAAEAHGAQVVGLSFSPAFPTQPLARDLAQLRQLLPAGIALWAGGSHPALSRHAIEGVTSVTALTQIGPLLADWAAARPPAA